MASLTYATPEPLEIPLERLVRVRSIKFRSALSVVETLLVKF